MAENRVEQLLLKVTGALDAVDIPYAVIGGNAVAAWVAQADVGAVRATKDVDLLVRRDDLERIRVAAGSVGLQMDEVLGLTVLLDEIDPRPSQGVHLILANEAVRITQKRRAPDVDDSTRADAGYRVLNLLPLLVMKLEAYRRVDQVHLEDMLRLGLIDAALAAKLPEDLRERLCHVRDTMEWFEPKPEF